MARASKRGEVTTPPASGGRCTYSLNGSASRAESLAHLLPHAYQAAGRQMFIPARASGSEQHNGRGAELEAAHLRAAFQFRGAVAVGFTAQLALRWRHQA